MRKHLPTPGPGRPALWVLLGILAMVVVTAGCDRTRPYGATEQPTAMTSPPSSESAPGLKMALPPLKVGDSWKFTYFDPNANNVALAGSFNDWNTGADALTKGEGGVWTIGKKLAPGTYQYKFVVNGTEWKVDPNNPNTADDGYGGKNSTLVVP